MKLKIFIWIVLRILSCFADFSAFALIINKKRSKWIVAVLESVWVFLIYIVLRVVHFKRPITWTVFASSWSWVIGGILSDVLMDAGKEIEINRYRCST